MLHIVALCVYLLSKILILWKRIISTRLLLISIWLHLAVVDFIFLGSFEISVLFCPSLFTISSLFHLTIFLSFDRPCVVVRTVLHRLGNMCTVSIQAVGVARLRVQIAWCGLWLGIWSTSCIKVVDVIGVRMGIHDVLGVSIRFNFILINLPISKFNFFDRFEPKLGQAWTLITILN